MLTNYKSLTTQIREELYTITENIYKNVAFKRIFG
jgi:hypothetical protein